jgi:hypothetical protein
MAIALRSASRGRRGGRPDRGGCRVSPAIRAVAGYGCARAILSLWSRPGAPRRRLLWPQAPQPTNPRSLALERRLAGYAERPGPDNAVDLAVAGRSPSAVGPVLIASPAGLLVRPEVGSSGTSPSPVEVSYAWAGEAAPATGASTK